jgi:hypothetical protein
VNGAASTPYDTAVGGTDFTYTSASGASTYWNTSNSSSGLNNSMTLSAKGPVPETVYNDSCTNSAFFSALGASTAATACNNAAGDGGDGVIGPVGSSGGFSNCTAPTGLAVSDCAGGYAKPTWQTGTGVPADGKRDVPDVSLFAGDNGASGTFYVVCQEDGNPPSPATACSVSQGTFFFVGLGGTSVSAQAFAGIVALIDQKNGGIRLGSVLFNQNLYALATAQGSTNCNNSGSTPLASSSPCVFKDVTTGTNSMPCVTGSVNCGTSSSQLAPISGPDFRWTPQTIVFAVCVFCGGMLLLILPGKQRRLRSALALLVFAIVLGSVSCGGGGSNGTVTGGGGGGNSVGILSGYNAGTGYDRATGLGSVNAANLVNAGGW